MTPERWRQVEEMYQSAMDREAESRADWLAEACAGDEELRREVESLLKLNSATVLVDQPAWQAAGELLDNDLSMAVGAQLGPYRIEGVLGAGGMGQVYRARDTRLDRAVAIKVSREEFGERFEREARAVAALNHPNICTLHDVGPNYLVMELVEGPTLAERIKQGPIPLEEALAIARQIGDALDIAHETGIVHRDLKPGNIKIKLDGTVKVLDFGLAKRRPLEPVSGRGPEDSPTISMAATRGGMILGTAAYMSPEQARGQEVDKRSDIWAFGVVLYEMLTGEQLFEGATVTDTLAAVLTKEPDWSKAPERTRVLLQRCLEKDPKRRLRDIGDAWQLLAAELPVSRPGQSKVAWTAAGIVTMVALVMGFGWWRATRPSDKPLVRFEIPLPENVQLPPPTFAVSPDARWLAFFVTESDGVRRMWLRNVDSIVSKPLAGTETSETRSAPFWSPDSKQVAFDAGGKLKRIDISGGPPQVVCEVRGGLAGGSWSRDGVIIFGSHQPLVGLMRVSAAGGTPSPLTAGGALSERTVFPTFLPDGKHFVYRRNAGPLRSGVFIGSLDARPDQQDSRRLLDFSTTVDYVPPSQTQSGQLLFVRDSTLMAQGLDERRLELTGAPRAVAERVGQGFGRTNTFAASTNGLLVYRNDMQEHQLTWFDRHGKPSGTVGRPQHLTELALSPGGTQAAISVADDQRPGAINIAVLDLATTMPTRLTFSPGAHQRPVWSADGRHVAFLSLRPPGTGIYQKNASGAGDEEPLVKSGETTWPLDWSQGGRYLIYGSRSPKTHADLWVLPLEGDRKPLPLLATESNESFGVLSPDSRWIAYVSDESGRDEVYVARFKTSAAAPVLESKWMVSKEGGVQVRWRRDGKELFYLTPDGTIVAVAVKTEPVFQAGAHHSLFRAPAEPYAWDVAADGQQFLLAAASRQVPLPSFTVVLNWTAALNK